LTVKKFRSNSGYNIDLAFFLISLLVFVLGIWLKLNAPLAEWDRVSLFAATNWSQVINTPWIFDHPPGYPIFLALVFKIFHASVSVVRITNAFCLFMTAFGAYKLVSWFYDKHAGLWAASLYLMSPIVIQSSQSIDMADTSLLPLAFIITFFCLARACGKSEISKDIFLIGLAVLACFWLKITSTIVLLSGIFFYMLLNLGNLNKTWVKKAFGGAVFGSILFLISWWSAAMFLWGRESALAPLKTVFLYFSSLSENHGFLNLMKGWTGLLRIIFWFSPFFLMLAGWQMYEFIKFPKRARHPFFPFLAWVVSFYFIVYLIIGGTNYGFPRYHAAIVPFLAIFLGVLIQDIMEKFGKKEKGIFFAVLFILTLIYAFLMDDFLLFLNLEWKEACLTGSYYAIFGKGLFQFFLFILLPSLTVFFFKKDSQKVFLILLMGTFATTLSMDIKQNLANYTTAYQYGARGKDKVLQMILRKIKDNDTVLTTPEFIYDLRIKKIPYISWEVWSSTHRVFDFIEKKKPRVIIMGLTTHTFIQWKNFWENAELQSLLGKTYDLNRIGTYYIWFKKIKIV